MKQTAQALLLILFLFCIVFCTTAQNYNKHYFLSKDKEMQSINNKKLPDNRTAFLFSNNNATSTYTNPAISILKRNSKEKQSKASVSGFITEEKTNKTKKKIYMFSNLTQDELWVQLENKENVVEKMEIEIYNQQGEIIYQSTIQENLHKINLCDFKNGTFLVKIEDTLQKIIIE